MTSRAGADSVRHRLQDVRWIGGGTGAGKSTVSRSLADEHHLTLYSSDDAIGEHARRSTPTDQPLLHEFIGMDMDMRWLHRSPEEMFETFHFFRGEAFEMIVDDVLKLSEHGPVLAEGFRLLPRLVAPWLSRPGQAVWLIPTPEFRRAAVASRGSAWDIAGRTTDPPRAFENLLARDELFTRGVEADARALRLRVLEVVPGTTLDELGDRVREALDLS
jgi:hypothetical protein